MLIADRHKSIIELVKKEGSVRVAELSRAFSKTEETIRRDLEKLEQQGKLIRSHGGAISVGDSDPFVTSYIERELTNVKEKRQIAMEAVKHVNEGDEIILDASTTAWYMAIALPNIKITVLTNSIKVATELSTKEKISVISTGGFLRPDSLSYIGKLAESSLESYHVNKAFISCKGFHLEHGMSESNEQQALVKEAMINAANTVYIMVDHSKFGVQAFTRLSSLDKIDCIITDDTIDPEIAKCLNDGEFRLIRA